MERIHRTNKMRELSCVQLGLVPNTRKKGREGKNNPQKIPFCCVCACNLMGFKQNASTNVVYHFPPYPNPMVDWKLKNIPFLDSNSPFFQTIPHI